jgi:hypothetical protein
MATLLVVFLVEILDDRPILRDWHPSQWCMVGFINTTGPSVPLLLNGPSAVTKRALIAVGLNGHGVLVVVLDLLWNLSFNNSCPPLHQAMHSSKYGISNVFLYVIVFCP